MSKQLKLLNNNMADKNTRWKQKDIEWYEVPTITGQKRYKVSTRNSKSMGHSDASVVVVQLIGGLIAMIYLIYTL